MFQPLDRWQAMALGLIVLIAIGLIAVGVLGVGGKQGLWANTVEVTVQFPEVHDILPGTSVRIRGVDAGHVTAVEYPMDDGHGSAVTVRMNVDAKFTTRLYADATAQVHPTGLLGAKVIAVQPGTPTMGPLVGGRLVAKTTPDISLAAVKIGATAEEVTELVREARTGNGTFARLLRDDKLYAEITGLAKDSRGMVKRASDTVGVVEKKANDVDEFVKEGRATLRGVKQGTEAVQSLPIIRDYVIDATKLLVRPDCLRDDVTYNAADIFEPNSAILTQAGKQHLISVANWVKSLKNSKSEVVVVALADPAMNDVTQEVASELTRKQSEVVVEFLKTNKAFKVGWFSTRKAIPVGLGHSQSPVVAHKLPPGSLQVIVFTPQ